MNKGEIKFRSEAESTHFIALLKKVFMLSIVK